MTVEHVKMRLRSWNARSTTKVVDWYVVNVDGPEVKRRMRDEAFERVVL